MNPAYGLVLHGLLLYTTEDHQPKGDTNPSGQHPPLTITQENAPQTRPYGKLDEGNSSNDAPSSQMTLAGIKLTKTNQQCP